MAPKVGRAAPAAPVAGVATGPPVGGSGWVALGGAGLAVQARLAVRGAAEELAAVAMAEGRAAARSGRRFESPRQGPR